MSDNKHTPGPVSNGQDKANAALIAAAPDMLAALELDQVADRAQDALDDRSNSDGYLAARNILADAGYPKTPGVHTPELIKTVRADARKLREAAIQKARGKS